jgi:hypothetical protein
MSGDAWRNPGDDLEIAVSPLETLRMLTTKADHNDIRI